MSVRLIRENSDTPNITNKDDARMARYAYGGKNGYVQNYGNEANHYVSGNVFTIGSGIIVLQGWEVVIDSNGWQLPLSSADATKRYYSVYLEINLALGGTASIRSQQGTYNYPDIAAGDDLTQNTSGIARLELYRFTAAAGVISNVQKIVTAIDYGTEEIKAISDFLDDSLKGLRDGTFKVGNSKTVNNIEFKLDDNGVLKLGNTIIPRKMLIWSNDGLVGSGSGSAGGTLTFSESIKAGTDVLEIESMIAGANLIRKTRDTKVAISSRYWDNTWQKMYDASCVLNITNNGISIGNAYGANGFGFAQGQVIRKVWKVIE